MAFRFNLCQSSFETNTVQSIKALHMPAPKFMSNPRETTSQREYRSSNPQTQTSNHLRSIRGLRGSYEYNVHAIQQEIVQLREDIEKLTRLIQNEAIVEHQYRDDMLLNSMTQRRGEDEIRLRTLEIELMTERTKDDAHVEDLEREDKRERNEMKEWFDTITRKPRHHQ
jgi:phage-related tail protein